MKIKDIIRASAVLLNEEQLVSYLETNNSASNSQIAKKINTLVDLTNLVINELGTTYVYMIQTERVTPVDGKIYFANLSKKIVKVVSVCDERGNNLSFSIDPEYILTQNCATQVKYAYVPENKSIQDECGYDEGTVSKKLLAYGLCAEYCLTQRRFDEAVMWHKRFMDGVSIICLPKTATLRKRSFS